MTRILFIDHGAGNEVCVATFHTYGPEYVGDRHPHEVENISLTPSEALMLKKIWQRAQRQRRQGNKSD